jgi:hypothetical protein
LVPILSLVTYASGLALGLERLYEVVWASWFKALTVWFADTYVKPRVLGTNPEKIGSWATMACSLVPGVLLAYAFRIDVLSPLAVAAGLTPNFYAGMIFTGLAIGGGSGLFHAIFGIYEQRKAAAKADLAFLEQEEKESQAREAAKLTAARVKSPRGCPVPPPVVKNYSYYITSPPILPPDAPPHDA